MVTRPSGVRRDNAKSPKPDARNQALVEQALNDFGAEVYRFALHQLRSHHDAENVCQDVFVSLLRSRTEFENDLHLKRWLLKATSCRCKNHWRYQSRHPEIATDFLESPHLAEKADSSPTAEDAYAVLWRHVNSLPDNQREAVYLFYVSELTVDEIAETVGVSASAVKTRLFRARRKLRKLLEGEHDEV